MNQLEKGSVIAFSLVALVAGDMGRGEARAIKVCDPTITASDYEQGFRTDKLFEANVLEPKDRPGIVSIKDIYTKREVFYPLVVCSHGLKAYFGRFGNRLREIPAEQARATEIYGETGDTLSSYDLDKVAVIEHKTLRTEPPDTTPRVNFHYLGFEEIDAHHYIYGQGR